MYKLIKNQIFLTFVVSMILFYNTKGFDYNGHRFTITNMPTFYVNSSGTPDCSNEFQAIQAALNTWNAVSTTYANFQYGGTTTNNSPGVQDGTNLIAWIESDWENYFPCSYAIAVNTTWFIVSSGKNIESDIAFNGEDYLWSDNGASGKYDVQNIATHELGHSISLGDLYENGDTEKTMYGYASTGETKKRTLHSDDIDGIRYVLFEAQTSGTLSENQIWCVHLDGNSISLSDNLSIPSGKTLTVKTGATINLNGHYIKSTGGTIVQESGSTINGLDAYLKYYSTLKGYFPTIQSAIDNAGYRYTVELLPKTYNENISIVDKYRRYIKGAGTGNTTINGNITITNSSYTIVSDFSMGDFKTITVNGGTSTNLSRISYSNTNGATYINVYNGSTTIIDELNYTASTASFGWNFYNTNSYNFYSNTIEGYDAAIYSTSGSDIGISETSFCNNLLDLYASSGSSIYGNHITMSYPGAYSGNCTFGAIDGYCGSMAKRDNLQTAENTIGISDNLKEANAAFRDLLTAISISKSVELSEENKNKIQSVIKKFKDVLSENLTTYEQNEVLKRLSACYKMLEDENSFANYVSNLISDKVLPNEMKRFIINSMVIKGNYNEALNLIEEVLGYKDISQNLEYELLYEKGTIQKYYLKENNLAKQTFINLVNKAGNNVLGKFAKAQLNDEFIYEENKESRFINTQNKINNFSIASYPNPFNPSTTITYQIPKDGFVNLTVYNSLGQEVDVLVNRQQTAGRYTVQFDASNLPSGVYFYRITAGEFNSVKKMLLVR